MLIMNLVFLFGGNKMLLTIASFQRGLFILNAIKIIYLFLYKLTTFIFHCHPSLWNKMDFPTMFKGV